MAGFETHLSRRSRPETVRPAQAPLYANHSFSSSSLVPLIATQLGDGAKLHLQNPARLLLFGRRPSLFSGALTVWAGLGAAAGARSAAACSAAASATGTTAAASATTTAARTLG